MITGAFSVLSQLRRAQHRAKHPPAFEPGTPGPPPVWNPAFHSPGTGRVWPQPRFQNDSGRRQIPFSSRSCMLLAVDSIPPTFCPIKILWYIRYFPQSTVYITLHCHQSSGMSQVPQRPDRLSKQRKHQYVTARESILVTLSRAACVSSRK